MYTRPQDLADADVAAAVAEGWGIDVDHVEYAPVGFGSHHWIATAADVRWFVTVDDLDARRRTTSETIGDAGTRLVAALTAMHEGEDGRELLASIRVNRFVPVDTERLGAIERAFRGGTAGRR